jgi:hypothetical protein
MQRFANLGVEVYITEMDVRFPTPLSQTDLQTQATIYSNVLARCRAQLACKALQVWGIPDKYSWIPDVFPGWGGALIFDDNYNAKPAYYALQSGLGSGNTPTPTPTTGANLLTNGNMENGTTGWSVFGSGTLASNTSIVHGGTRSLLITGRTAAWNGPSQSVTSKLTNGRTYTTNVWVRTQSGTPSAKVTLQLTANGTTSYITLAPSATVNSSGWTLLAGTATVSWSGTLSSANFYVETNSGTDSFYIDDASLTDGTNAPTNTPTRTNTPTPTQTVTPTRTPTPSGNLLTNGNIESGTSGWSVLGSGTLFANTSVVHGGSQSLLITGRTAAWNGPSQSMTSKLTNNRTYTTNVWVRTQSGTASAKVTLQLTANGTTSYITLAPAATVNSSGWTLLSGTANVSWSGTLSSANFYVETTSGTASFYIDDASFQ